jgi:hypothetical protein
MRLATYDFSAPALALRAAITDMSSFRIEFFLIVVVPFVEL